MLPCTHGDRVPARARRAHRQGRHRLAARPFLPAPAAAPDTPRTARGAVTARILGSACARTPVSYVLPLAWIYEE